MKISQVAATAVIALAAGSVFASELSVTPVVTSNDTLSDGTYFSGATDVVLDNQGNVATFATNGDYDAVVTYTGAGASKTKVVANLNIPISGTSDATLDSFTDLSLNAGTLYFAAPTAEITGSGGGGGIQPGGIFTSSHGAAASPVFYSDATHNSSNIDPNTNPTQQTINTAGYDEADVIYNISPTNQVNYGTRSIAGQEIYSTSVPTPLNTTGLQNFNLTASSTYPIKTVALDPTDSAGPTVVAIAEDSSTHTYGVYDLTATPGTVSARYSTIVPQFSGGNYAPRQLIGATNNQSIVFAENTAPSSGTGVVFYQNGSQFTALTTEINSTQDRPITGEMTPLGKAVVFVQDVGLIYQDADGNSGTLTTGSTVTDSDGSQTISDFGLGGNVSPMINENGWIVSGATFNGDDLPQGLIGWNPKLDISEIIAKVGDTFTMDGVQYVIDDFVDNATNDDTDILKDGLNEQNQVAFAIDYSLADGEGYYPGVLTANLTAVPEPASLGLLAIAGIGLLRRRRRGTPS